MKKKLSAVCLLVVILVILMFVAPVTLLVKVEAANIKSETDQGLINAELMIPEGKQAVYSASITYNDSLRSSGVSIMLGSTDFFKLKNKNMWISGAKVTGIYNYGTYGIKLYVNPQQNIAYVEISLPDGGIIRRGNYNLASAYKDGVKVAIIVDSENNISDVSVEYVDIFTNDYELVTVEPSYTGFESMVYNLCSSFDIASTTRNFSWTALTSYIGSDSMSVRYRAEGSEEWSTIEALRVVELAVNDKEDYFKANLTDLTPNTVYEYQIGKTNSENASDWGIIYKFTTANTDNREFTFLAIGDTQGITWNGKTDADKGFMFAEAAFTEMFDEVPDPAFIVHTGDIVEYGYDANLWNMYFKALRSRGATTAMFHAIGNHDSMSINYKDFYFNYHFNHPNNGGNAAFDSSVIPSNVATENTTALKKNAEEMIYSFDYGSAHFIVLNSGNYSDDDRYILEAQRNWLKKDLETNKDAKWKIIIVHEPVYHRKGGNESRPWLYDVIEAYDVDLVIQGHSHLVTRTYPMKNGEVATKKYVDEVYKGTGTIYTTIGSTAYNHDSIGNPNMKEIMTDITPDPAQPTYTVVNVCDEKLTMTIKQIDGFVVDSFTITTNPDCSSEYSMVIESGGALSQTGEHMFDERETTSKLKSKGNTGFIIGIVISVIIVATGAIILVKK